VVTSAPSKISQDEFEFVTSPEVPDAGTYRGEEARRWVWNWVNAFEGLTMEAMEIIDAGDKVVVGIIQRGRFRGSQALTQGRWWNVLTFRDQNLIRSERFAERSRPWKPLGIRVAPRTKAAASRRRRPSSSRFAQSLMQLLDARRTSGVPKPSHHRRPNAKAAAFYVDSRYRGDGANWNPGRSRHWRGCSASRGAGKPVAGRVALALPGDRRGDGLAAF
jgi:ketosteroid isomerase-like protein